MLLKLLAIVAAVCAVLLLASWIARLRWHGASGLLEERLRAGAVPQVRVTYLEERDLVGLPAPVQRYFRHVLPNGVSRVQQAVVRHVGTFRMGDAATSWKPFDSVEHFSTDRPGFLWDASIHVGTGLDVLVRDSYIAGTGSLRASMGGLVPLSHPGTSEQLNEGALQRYLAEAVWFPTALLPSDRLQWTGLDDSTACATLSDGNTRVSLVFTFNGEGEIVRAHAPARMYEHKGRYTPHPWTTRCWNYAERGGMRIPLCAEVLWHFPQGDHPYWRGEVVGMEPDAVAGR